MSNQMIAVRRQFQFNQRIFLVFFALFVSQKVHCAAVAVPNSLVLPPAEPSPLTQVSFGRVAGMRMAVPASTVAAKPTAIPSDASTVTTRNQVNWTRQHGGDIFSAVGE